MAGTTDIADRFDIADVRARLHRDGAVKVPGVLRGAALDAVMEAYDWSLTHPSPGRQPHAGDQLQIVDTAHPDATAAYTPMLLASPVSRLISQLWDDRAVWFLYEQIWFKQGTSQRTLWHQDSPYLPVAGEHVVVAWMSFDRVTADDALEFCLGSHLGHTYSPPSMRQDDPFIPLYDDARYPRMPAIDDDRGRWPIAGWATDPGDIVLFHPNTIHGGSAPGPARQRRSLALRFFGEEAVYVERPLEPKVPRVDGLHTALRDGDLFRHPAFLKVA